MLLPAVATVVDCGGFLPFWKSLYNFHFSYFSRIGLFLQNPPHPPQKRKSNVISMEIRWWNRALIHHGFTTIHHRPVPRRIFLICCVNFCVVGCGGFGGKIKNLYIIWFFYFSRVLLFPQNPPHSPQKQISVINNRKYVHICVVGSAQDPPPTHHNPPRKYVEGDGERFLIPPSWRN